MKNLLCGLRPFLFALLFLSLSGCEIIGDIFKAGMWVGVILVALFIGIIFWIFSRFRR